MRIDKVRYWGFGVVVVPRKSARLFRWAVVVGAMVGGCAAMGAEVSSGAVATAGAERHQAHAVSGATTAELFLCIGPVASCPSTGTVNPTPTYQPMLAMQFGQTWNGTMDAYANDGSVITGTISLEDSYNGGPAQTYCTLNVAAGGTCAASVGTTMGTAVGTHVLSAVYSGDASDAGSVSASVTIVVSQETTMATLMGAPNPGDRRSAGNADGDGGRRLRSANRDGDVHVRRRGDWDGEPGCREYRLQRECGHHDFYTLPVGQDTVTAVYASTTDFTSASATWVETITPAPAGSFALRVAPNPATVGVGLGAQLIVTVTPANGFAEDVKLSCANLPQEATCVFANSTIASGNGTTSLIVQTTARHKCGTTTPYFLGDWGGGGSTFGRGNVGLNAGELRWQGCSALFLPQRRRRWLRLSDRAGRDCRKRLQMTGCGNCTGPGYAAVDLLD